MKKVKKVMYGAFQTEINCSIIKMQCNHFATWPWNICHKLKIILIHFGLSSIWTMPFGLDFEESSIISSSSTVGFSIGSGSASFSSLMAVSWFWTKFSSTLTMVSCPDFGASSIISRNSVWTGREYLRKEHQRPMS